MNTIPQRTLSHLMRMKREADAMISEPTFDSIGAARWRNRLDNYIKTRCSTFYKLPQVIIRGISEEDIEQSISTPFNRGQWDEQARKQLRDWMFLLESIIEQAEGCVEKNTR